MHCYAQQSELIVHLQKRNSQLIRFKMGLFAALVETAGWIEY